MAAKNPLQELEALRVRVREAEARVASLDAEQRRSARKMETAFAPLRQYHEALGAGEREADPTLEAELLAGAQEVKASVVFSPKVNSSGRHVGFEAVDHAVDAQLSGAHRGLDEAKSAVTWFIRDHRAEIEAELVPQALAAHKRFLKSYAAFEETVAEWLTVAAAYDRFAVEWLGAERARIHPVISRFQEAMQAPMPADPDGIHPLPTHLIEGESK